jgi:tetratricopeptide (TPR) repeat protein
MAKDEVIKVAVAIACFLSITFLIFFAFLRFEVGPLASGILGLLGGIFIVLIVMGLSGIVRELAIKSPFLEISSKLVEKVQSVQNDVNQTKEDVANVSESVRFIQQSLQTLMLTNTIMSNVKNDVSIHNFINGLAEKASQTTQEVLSGQGIEKRFDPKKKTVIPERDKVLIKDVLELEEVIRNAKEILSSKSNTLDIGATMQKANYFYYQGNYEKALELYNKVLEKKPDHVDALIGKSFTLNNLGNFKEAISAISEAEEIQSSNPSVLYAKGQQLHNMNRFQQAEDCFRKVSEIYPNEVHVLSLIAHEIAEQEKYVDANNFIDSRILPLEPSDQGQLSFIYFLKGWIFYQLERDKESKEFFEKSWKIDSFPVDSGDKLHRAIAAAHAGSFEDALSYVQQSSYLAPDNPFLPFTESRIYLLQGKTELALKRLKKAIDMRPEFRETVLRQREFRQLKDNPEYIKIIS